jgi:hypothetical protein
MLSALSIVTGIATGIANQWKPHQMIPSLTLIFRPAMLSSNILRAPFVVSCQERTARYLYFNPSDRSISSVKRTAIYRGLSLISTLLLIGGVISLTNACIESQTAFAGSYMLISIFYWIGVALPSAQHWELSQLEVEQIEVSGGTPPRSARVDNYSPTYTEALWKAIAVTGTSNWVKEAGWAPKTPAWNDWLNEAEDAALGEPLKSSVKMVDGKAVEVWTIRSWDSRNALSTLLRSTTDKIQAQRYGSAHFKGPEHTIAQKELAHGRTTMHEY